MASAKGREAGASEFVALLLGSVAELADKILPKSAPSRPTDRDAGDLYSTCFRLLTVTLNSLPVLVADALLASGYTAGCSYDERLRAEVHWYLHEAVVYHEKLHRVVNVREVRGWFDMVDAGTMAHVPLLCLSWVEPAGVVPSFSRLSGSSQLVALLLDSRAFLHLRRSEPSSVATVSKPFRYH